MIYYGSLRSSGWLPLLKENEHARQFDAASHDRGPELLDRQPGAPHVLAIGEPVHHARAFGQGREDQRPVRHRLVTGHGQVALQPVHRGKRDVHST